MSRQPQSRLGHEARHRLRSGFIARLARSPDADAYALRGGMLVAHWFGDTQRPVRDIDLVCRLPYDRALVRDQLTKMLADPTLRDGVHFDAQQFRLDLRWPTSPHPGLRLFVAGRADGWWADMTVDLTFHLDVWPAARRGELYPPSGAAPLWLCAPEMLVARKLRVTAELGPRRWRPKDISDVYLMVERFDSPLTVLGPAIERSFGPHFTPDHLAEILTPSWGTEPGAAARWGRARRGRRGIPRDLRQAIDRLRSKLSPMTNSR